MLGRRSGKNKSKGVVLCRVGSGSSQGTEHGNVGMMRSRLQKSLERGALCFTHTFKGPFGCFMQRDFKGRRTVGRCTRTLLQLSKEHQKLNLSL